VSTVRGTKPCTPRYEVMALRNSGHGSDTRNEKVSILEERPLSQRRSKQGSTMATREVLDKATVEKEITQVFGYVSLEEQVDRDFTRARRKASLRRIKAQLRKEHVPNRLLSMDEVKGSLGAYNQVYRGMRVVPVEKIVGSLNRYGDFDSTFLPARESLETKWKSVDRAYHRIVELPPVSLFKIGEKYFVVDGNHRVSVARYQSVEYIDAEVTELRVQSPKALRRAYTRTKYPKDEKRRREK
jgi:hypothetical protein